MIAGSIHKKHDICQFTFLENFSIMLVIPLLHFVGCKQLNTTIDVLGGDEPKINSGRWSSPSHTQQHQGGDLRGANSETDREVGFFVYLGLILLNKTVSACFVKRYGISDNGVITMAKQTRIINPVLTVLVIIVLSCSNIFLFVSSC